MSCDEKLASVHGVGEDAREKREKHDWKNLKSID
jgi:hypothetical protein